MDSEEGWIGARLRRADASQLAGAPVHSDEVNAFATRVLRVCPDVHQRFVAAHPVSRIEIFRATRAGDDAERCAREKVPPRQIASLHHPLSSKVGVTRARLSVHLRNVA